MMDETDSEDPYQSDDEPAAQFATVGAFRTFTCFVHVRSFGCGGNKFIKIVLSFSLNEFREMVNGWQKKIEEPTENGGSYLGKTTSFAIIQRSSLSVNLPNETLFIERLQTTTQERCQNHGPYCQNLHFN